MGTAGECTQTRHLLGVYLLGAIDPAGRAAVECHLAQCAECRKELAGLASLPAMLSRVPAAEVYQPGEPAPAAGQPAGPGLPRLLRGTATARRTRRWRELVMAAAAVVLAAALGAGVQHVLNPQARPVPETGSWLAVSARNGQTLASATVAYSARGWGTALDVRVRQVPAGTTCQLWVTNRSGQQAEAGGWTIVRGPQRAWYPASTSFAASTLRSFAITTGHRTLVSVQVRR
jgi:hypothetical protein